jgi:hypothetical protein
MSDLCEEATTRTLANSSGWAIAADDGSARRRLRLPEELRGGLAQVRALQPGREDVRTAASADRVQRVRRRRVSPEDKEVLQVTGHVLMHD